MTKEQIYVHIKNEQEAKEAKAMLLKFGENIIPTYTNDIENI